MNYLVAMGVAVLGAVAVPGAAFAAPGTPGNTVKIPLVNDCGNGSINGQCVNLDHIGTFAGVVKYRHKANGDLRLMIQVKSAPHGANYKLEIYCGMSAASPGALVGSLADAVSTDNNGTASAGPFEVPSGDIQHACGPGGSVGHVELVDIVGGSILDAAPVKLLGSG